ncbi:MAG TPA: SRPBCC domain-containing protein, partial [Saprospiraceae bacterium]|nr:SRPBCC domain-containing protein [Saprospiraceae bacterium]
MKKTFLFNFDVDKAHKQIKIKRSFDAPRDLVWSAWTEAEILDQWWAPQPYINKTKSMHFHEGGHWLYSMTGP